MWNDSVLFNNWAETERKNFNELRWKRKQREAREEKNAGEQLVLEGRERREAEDFFLTCVKDCSARFIKIDWHKLVEFTQLAAFPGTVSRINVCAQTVQRFDSSLLCNLTRRIWKAYVTRNIKFIRHCRRDLCNERFPNSIQDIDFTFYAMLKANNESGTSIHCC